MFCSDISCSNHGITILYLKSSSHSIPLFKIRMKMVTIMVKIATKLIVKCIPTRVNAVIPEHPNNIGSY